ncbi:MAG TPA: efflux RND transporter periplasmic adaptor subunit, partial [Gemmatimonadaceae bacterium]|nr:efflux RND transporter periplasmic adaptor subunit [Gemmatimonadaceae bacterium]
FTDIQRYYRNGNALQVRAQPSEGSAIPVDGALAFVDNSVDTTSGTVLLKARFSNPEGSILPGQYMNVALQLYVDPNALTLPAPAVLTGQQGTYVYTVDTAGTATQTPVQVSRTVDSVAVIASGLREGERVVVDGQSRLIPGAKVLIKGPPGTPAAPAASGAPR